MSTTTLHRYDDIEILAGQGTAALEILEQMDRMGTNIDAVVIPVGGGGLLAGMATIFKHLQPTVEVIVSYSTLIKISYNSVLITIGC